MAVPSNVLKNKYQGNGVQTAFAYGFKIFDTSQVIVKKIVGTTETLLTLDTDYTVSGVGDDSGGNITYPVSGSPLPSGQYILIKPNFEYVQNTILNNQNTFPPKTVENALDVMTMQIKQIAEELDRAVQVGDAFDGNPEDFMDEVLNAVDDTEADRIAAAASASAAAASAAAAAASAALFPINNYSATTDPTVNDDSGDGYSVGSQWINTTDSGRFICSSAALGAAVWTEITSVDPGDLGSAAYENLETVRLIPQNIQDAAYTLVLSDGGKHILHSASDSAVRTWTIPANASVAYPIGTAITFVNRNATHAVNIAITSDTLLLAYTGATGTRTLAAYGVATAIKVTSTEWIISGVGLS